MDKCLLMFLFSDTIDTYVNVIAHAFDSEDLRVRKVVLIHVLGTKADIDETEAGMVNTRIWRQLESLANGEYIQFPRISELRTNPQAPEQKKQLPIHSNVSIYRRINEKIEHSLSRIENSKIQEQLNGIIKKEGGRKKCILDITATTKVPSINIFSVCLALGIDNLYVFELKQSVNRNVPELSLYHNLINQQDFAYTCLTKNETVSASRSSLVQKSTLLWILLTTSSMVLVASFSALYFYGSESFGIQLINLIASVTGIGSSAFALIEQRRQH